MSNLCSFTLGRGLAEAMLLAARSSRADVGQMVVWLLAAGVALGVVCGGLAVANRMVRSRRLYSHPALFAGLCTVHGLNVSSRRLLKRVVKSHRLVQPARLFVEPRWLDPAGLGAAFEDQAGELEKLRSRLFNIRSSQPGAG